jgi:hypothetical protein
MKRIITIAAFVLVVSVLPLVSAEQESLAPELAEKILTSLTKVGEISDWGAGFDKIEDVDWRFVSLAGIHSRRIVYKDWFLFPYWNMANSEFNKEPKGWDTGLAVKKGSKVLYAWTLNKKVDLEMPNRMHIAGYETQTTEPNQALQRTNMLVTDCAPSSTLRAKHVRR